MLTNITETADKSRTDKSEKISILSIILLALAAVSLIILIVARRSPVFADFFNQHIGSLVRAVLAKLTDPLPFSLAELLILLLPVMLVGLILFATRKKSKSWRGLVSYTVSLIAAVSLIFSLFVLGYGTGYHVPALDKKLGLTSAPVTAEELQETALWLTEEIAARTTDIYFSSDGSSVMPYSLSDMGDKLIDSYRGLCEKYDFLQCLTSDIKPVMNSVAMSYAHLTGVYTFFTGEANLNVDFPDYTLPYTAAHELAHQRGIARENEANFVAFLVCISSEDPYLQYSGYVNLYEYVASSLYTADKDLYREAQASLSVCVVGEIRAYSNFYSKYRDSEAGKVNNAVNNAFLQANGSSEGTRSYGMVVDLAVAYYKDGCGRPTEK